MSMASIMLTPHFSLEEMIVSEEAARRGINNRPPPDIVENLKKLCQTLEIVRAALDKPMVISSGYRCPELNKAIGGAANSAHLYGLAADFIVPEFGNAFDVCLAIKKLDPPVIYDQLIYEFDSWVHLGLVHRMEEARNQNLTINAYGTTVGIA
jgi:hypothetical protein